MSHHDLASIILNLMVSKCVLRHQWPDVMQLGYRKFIIVGYQHAHPPFRYAQPLDLTLRLYQLFSIWCCGMREACDRLLGFSHACRIRSDTLRLNNDLHRHQPTIRFNQESRRHRENVQSVSHSYHGSKFWILPALT